MFLTLVPGLVVTLAAFGAVRNGNHDRLAERFERVSVHLELAARQRLENDFNVLFGLRDAFDAVGMLSRREFGTFARAQLSRHPGIQALEWTPVVTASERAAVEAAARREGLPGFRLTERDAHGRLVDAGRRDTYYPVLYVEPLAGNEPALGYAPVLETRDLAIAHARDTAQPTASQAFPIVQSPQGRVGVAVFVPVYAGGAVPSTLGLRRARLRGLVEGVMMPAEMLKPLVDEARSLGVTVSLTDLSAPPGERALIGETGPAGQHGASLRHDVPIDMGTRHWLLGFTLADTRVIAGQQGTEWLVLVLGLVATGLLGGYLQTLFERRARAEHLVEERTRALRRAQALDAMKSNFVNGVSHDLRTPLTSIRGYAEFLEDAIGGPLSPEQQGFVVQIMRGAQRLERLVDDLLDFARLDAGTFHLKREPADLGHEIREVAESFGPQLEEAHLTLETSSVVEPLEAMMDVPRIERVLVNLLHNAIKFTPAGGTIRMRAGREDGHLRCEIEDSGVGIAADQIPRLFQRFSQLEGGSGKGGTGLGLSIAKAIVEAHGGAIGVTSVPGRGSTFWFTLPSEKAPRPEVGTGGPG